MTEGITSDMSTENALEEADRKHKRERSREDDEDAKANKAKAKKTRRASAKGKADKPPKTDEGQEKPSTESATRPEGQEAKTTDTAACEKDGDQQKTASTQLTNANEKNEELNKEDKEKGTETAPDLEENKDRPKNIKNTQPIFCVCICSSFSLRDLSRSLKKRSRKANRSYRSGCSFFC